MENTVIGNVLKQVSLDLPANLPVVSDPVNTWNPIKALALSTLMASNITLMSMIRCDVPFPVRNLVILQRLGYQWTNSRKTSVSGEKTSRCDSGNFWLMSMQWSIIKVSASSWLCSFRFSDRLALLLLASVPETIVKVSWCCKKCFSVFSARWPVNSL